MSFVIFYTSQRNSKNPYYGGQYDVDDIRNIEEKLNWMLDKQFGSSLYDFLQGGSWLPFGTVIALLNITTRKLIGWSNK